MNERGNDPVIVSAVRTPIGRRGGVLSDVHPSDLVGTVLLEALARGRVPAGEVGHVLMGCVTQAGEQAYNIARNSAIAAGLPDHVAGATLDAQCGSSQQAVNLAAALVASGAEDVVLAAGVESMSRIPLRTAIEGGPGDPLSQAYRERVEVINQGESAERIADRWDVGRLECDAIGLRSQERAKEAREQGRFEREIVPVTVDGAAVTADQGIRDTTAEALAALKPAFRPDGRHTAGNSSQISDGAAALVVTSRRWADANGVPVRSVIRSQSFVGVDPVLKLTGPIPATRAVLDRSGLTVDEIDVFEISEAFASVVAAWMREFRVSDERLNVNGGAIALGHPVGASGARMIVTALHELERTDAERALVAMCCGGGLGTGTLIERPR